MIFCINFFGLAGWLDVFSVVCSDSFIGRRCHWIHPRATRRWQRNVHDSPRRRSGECVIPILDIRVLPTGCLQFNQPRLSDASVDSFGPVAAGGVAPRLGLLRLST